MIFFWPQIILALRHDFEAPVPAFPGCSVSKEAKQANHEPPNERPAQLQLGISVETGLTTTRSFAPFCGLAQDFSNEPSVPDTDLYIVYRVHTRILGISIGGPVPRSSSLINRN
jgi:hypothetical protein